jgi:hypothetical protein
VKGAASQVITTLQKTIVPDPIPAHAEPVLPHELTRYEQNGYGSWSYAPGLDVVKRLDLMPAGYDGASATAAAKLLIIAAHIPVGVDLGGRPTRDGGPD